jgi:putative acetyltransferase
MSEKFTLSWATLADYGEISDVMFEAVRTGPSKYTEAQRAAWVPHRRSGEDWELRLGRQAIVLARSQSAVVGFMSITPDGYIDFAYIRPTAQGTGLFRRLFNWIEKHSLERGDERMWTHASLMAQPAFAAMGFTVVEYQSVNIGGESFDRAEMERLRSVSAD